MMMMMVTMMTMMDVRFKYMHVVAGQQLEWVCSSIASF